MKRALFGHWFQRTTFFDHFFHWSELVARTAWSRLYAWWNPVNPDRGKPLQMRPAVECLEPRYVMGGGPIHDVFFSSATYSVAETAGNATITVDLGQSSTGTVTVNYATADGTAVAGVDYTSSIGTLTFNPGDVAKTFNVPILNHNALELSTTLLLTLSSPSAPYILGTPSAATLTIQDNNIPVGNDPRRITTGPDGNLWVTEFSGDQVDKITTAGTVTSFALTTGSAPLGIVTGPDGNLWFTETGTNKIAKITVAGVVTEYALANAGSTPWLITVGADGALWFSEKTGDRIGRITTGGSITEYTLTSGSTPEGITLGKDGNVWFAEYGTNNIASITPGGTVTQYTVTSTGPAEITTGPDGNLWFTAAASGYVGRMSTDGNYSLFTPPNADTPEQITTGPDGNLWFGVEGTNQLDSLTPDGSTFTGATGVTTDNVDGLTVGPDKALWFTDATANAVGRYADFLSGSVVENGPLPDSAMVTAGYLSLSPQSGDVQEKIPFDVADSVAPDCGCGGTPVNPTAEPLAFIYNSTTVDVKPFVQFAFDSDPNTTVPTNLEAQLTWDNGTPQSWVSFSTSGHSPGDVYVMTLQDSTAVGSTGEYPWSVEVQATLADGSVVDRTIGGSAAVVANDASPFGAGWTIAGLDSIVPVTGGVLYVSGDGWAEFFASQGGSTYLSPPDNFGTLVTSGSDYLYTDKYQMVYDFNSSGQLVSVTDPNGLARTFSYSSGLVSTITEPDGGVGTFTYSSGYLSTIQAPGSRTLTLTISSGTLAVFENADSSLRYFTYNGNNQLTEDDWGSLSATVLYDANGLVTGVQLDSSATIGVSVGETVGLGGVAASPNDAVGTITDANGHATNFTMNAQGQVSQEVTADGAVWTFLLDFAGQATETIDPTGAATRYQYDYGVGKGDLTQITFPGGTFETFTYDSTFHRITGERDTQNHLTTNTYDGNGNQLTKTSAPGQTTAYSWLGGRVTTVTDPFGNVTSYAYDTALRVKTMTVPGGGVFTYTYDGAGNQLTVTDPLLHTTTTLYDALRRLTSTIDPQGNAPSSTYNTQGQVTSSSDADGNSTTYSFDDQGRPLATTQAAGTGLARTSTNLYDAAGNVTGVQDALGNLTQFLFDAVNRQTGMIDPMGNGSSTLYDLAGHVTESIDANGNATKFLFDAAGRQTVTIDALNNRSTSLYDVHGNLTGQLDQRGDLTQYLYDSSDRLTVVIDAKGNHTTSLYDAAGNVTQVTDALNQTTQFLYDANERLSVVINPIGGRTTTLFDAHGNATEVIDPNGNATQFLFDSAGRASVTIDAAGGRTTNLYDAAGQVTGQLDQRGDLTKYLFDADGRQTVVIDAVGGRTTTLYDPIGNVTESIDARGNGTQFLFDALNRQTVVINALSGRTTTMYDALDHVTGVSDPNGNLSQFLFDAAGRETVNIDAAGGRTTTLYDANGNATQVTDAAGHTTQFLFDALNRSTVTIDPLTHRATSMYDAAGNLTEQTDFNGTPTYYLFDALNRASVIIDGNSARTTTLFDAVGQVTGVQDTAGGLTQYLFDGAGRTSVTIYPDGKRTTSLFDANGNVTSLTDINNRTTTFLYDALNRMTLSVDSTGKRTTSLYDATGNVTGSYDSSGNLLQFLFDGLNRTTLSIDGSGARTTTMFDAVGNTTSVNVAGDQTQYLFDALNRQSVMIDPLNGRTTNLFDANGNLTSTTDSDGNTTTFAYDALNRVTSQTDPFAHPPSTMAYNAVGLLTGTTDQLGRQIKSYFDADGRLTGQTWVASNGITVEQLLTYSYDNNGNQLTAADNSGAYTMSYDGLGRVTGVLEPFGQQLTFSYDAQGNRTVVQDSLGGTTTSAYDDNQQLVERELGGSGTAPLRVDLTYNELGQNDSITRYNDLAGLATQVVATTGFSYDVYGRVTNLQHLNGSSGNIANYTYSYNAQGQVQSETRNGTTITYTYDASGQLTGDGSSTVTYDANGVRNNGSNTPGTDNQLTSDGTWTYSYDLDGNLISKSLGIYGTTWEYAYDEKNQLLSAKKWDAAAGPRNLLSADYFKYDALGNRIEHDIDSNGDSTIDTTQRYALDGWKPAKGQGIGNQNFDVWADLDGSNNLESRYLGGDVVDQLFARVDKSGATYTAYWMLTDDLGSVRDVTDNSGTVQASVAYDGFGNATITGTNTAAVGRYLWTGREFDAETGLQYNRGRYYDSNTGRWISQDPMGFSAGDSNLYRYALNNPTQFLDPSGLAPISVLGNFAGGSTTFFGYPITDGLYFGPKNSMFSQNLAVPNSNGKIIFTPLTLTESQFDKGVYTIGSGLDVTIVAHIDNHGNTPFYYWRQSVDTAVTSKDNNLNKAYKGPDPPGTGLFYYPNQLNDPQSGTVGMGDSPLPLALNIPNTAFKKQWVTTWWWSGVTTITPDKKGYDSAVANADAKFGFSDTKGVDKFQTQLMFGCGLNAILVGTWDWEFAVSMKVTSKDAKTGLPDDWEPEVDSIKAKWTPA